MKKLILVSCMVFSIIAHGVAAEKDDFQFGIRMGAQFSKVKGYEDVAAVLALNEDKIKMIVGPAFGFVFEIPVNPYFEIRPELNFGSQGQIVQFTSDLKRTDWLGYVQVPILLRGQFGSEKVRGFLHVGPQIGYGTFFFSKVKDKNGEDEKESSSFKDQDLKPFDAGIAVGAGIEFPKANGMELEVRYYNGMTDIFDDEPNMIEFKNRSIHLNLCVKF